VPPYFSTVMMQSGHMVAQKAQPMQFSGETIWAGEYPFLLIVSVEIAKHFLGQASTHRPQPLHISVLKVTFAMILPP